MPSDSSPEIDIGVRPEDNLSSKALSTLTGLVLVPSSELAFRRLDALQLLLDEWDELESPSDYADWVQRLGAAPLVTHRREDGSLERSDETTGEPAVPAGTIAVLAKEIIGRESVERIRAIEGLRDLLAEWAPCFDDEEKLLGHLLRVHEQDASIIRLGHDDLLRHHANIHRVQINSG